jgi:hypothetical protein
MMKTWKKYPLLLLLAFALAGFGCSDGGSRPAGDLGATLSGSVVQGPVSGALIIADKNGNYLLDSDEAFTFSDANGDFNDLVIPDGYGSYVLVSTGGIDTLTDQPALPMLAPAGAKNITPITTLVALTPEADRAALIADLDALAGEGNGYDSDPSEAAKADFVSLVKVVESTLYLMQDLGVTETGDQFLVATKISSQLIEEGTIAAVVAGTASTMSDSVQLGVVASLQSLADSPTTEFSVKAGSETDFGAIIKAVAVAVEAGVTNATDADGNVSEAELAPVADVDTIIAADPTLVSIESIATSIALGLESVTLLDAAGLETSSAGAATRVEVVLSAFNNTTSNPKNYSDVALTLAVQDRNSQRSVAFKLTGVFLSVTAAADASLLSVDLSGAALAVTATKSDGTQISTNDVTGAFEIFDANFGGNQLLLNLDEVQNLFADQVAADFATVGAVGEYGITLQATGAPIGSAAKIVTIVP